MADPFIGTINMFGFQFAPRDWTACSGQLLQISQFTTVFSLVGTYYGGDGRVSFGIPELRGRAPIHYGNHPGSSYNWMIGQAGGTEFNTLSIPNLPSHNHVGALHVSSADSTQSAATAGSTIATPGSTSGRTFTATEGFNASNPDVTMNSASVTTGMTGAGQSVNNIEPFLAVNYIIALQGVYPSRS